MQNSRPGEYPDNILKLYDSDGNKISDTYLKTTGGTITGTNKLYFNYIIINSNNNIN